MKNKDIKKIANKVINLEIQALRQLKKSINSSFETAVKEISKCKSKVIISGVGKSGIIARKIASTFSSIGTPSYYLNANDCSHGDLGSIRKKDLVILISNSGSSAELKNIIKYVNLNKITLIGIVSKKNSTLYKGSDIKIFIPEVIEAGLGIVPTSSTTSQLCIGDALAVCLLESKKITKKDFKKYHPSGNLGASLKAVEDIMVIGNGIPFINENSKMSDALKEINKKKLGTLVVRNKQLKTIGIITDGQLRRVTSTNINFKNLTPKDIMTSKPMSIDKETYVNKALSIMNENKITCLCVHKNNRVNKTIGIIHIHHILGKID